MASCSALFPTVQQPYPLRQLSLDTHAANVCNGSRPYSQTSRVLADCQTQTDEPGLLQQHSAADEAVCPGPELQRLAMEAAAMRRGVVAALQQAQNKSQAQVRLSRGQRTH
jgi:hypothetical protein